MQAVLTLKLRQFIIFLCVLINVLNFTMSSEIFNITTHVLDTSKGLPVSGLTVKLYRLKDENEWTFINQGRTAETGRCNDLTLEEDFSAGIYKLNFAVKEYYNACNMKTMYPFIEITFEVDKSEHYHMPLLLNAYGYTTYRGS